jgi:hypothetical protein
MTHVYKVNPSLLLRVKSTFVLMDFMDYMGFIYQDQFYPIFCQVHPILSKSIHPPQKKRTSLGLCHSHHLSLLHCLSTWFLGAQREGFEVYPLVILTPGNGKIQETQPLCKGWSEIQWRGLLEKKSKLRPFWGALTCLDSIPSRKFIQGCWKHVPGN